MDSCCASLRRVFLICLLIMRLQPTDCAGKMPWLTYPPAPGVAPIGGGSRWDGTIWSGAPSYGSCEGKSGSASTFSTAYKQSLRRFWEAQVTTYEKASGWVYWTWKSETASFPFFPIFPALTVGSRSQEDWSYNSGLVNGWIPYNPAERLYPNICG